MGTSSCYESLSIKMHSLRYRTFHDGGKVQPEMMETKGQCGESSNRSLFRKIFTLLQYLLDAIGFD